MHTEYRLANEGNGAEIIKDLSEVLPWVSIAVFFYYFIIKAVDIAYLAWLVISPKDSDECGVLCFETHDVGDCLHWVVASVDIVAHEDVFVSLRGLTPNPEQL